MGIRTARGDGPFHMDKVLQHEWHTMEGPDDMPAHVRSALTAVQLSVPFSNRSMLLGTWQGIYLWEHRTAPHRRQIVLHAQGVTQA